MNEKFGENIDLIDNENKEINENLDKKQDLIALGILKSIDNQIKGYDIDLAKNRDKNEYYFIGNNEERLKIPIKIEDLDKIGGILIELFNKDIQLFGSAISGRSIAENTWKLDGIEKKIISSENTNFSKNDIEELFIFIMKTKGIIIDDWNIKSTICKGGINNKCKEDLGN